MGIWRSRGSSTRRVSTAFFIPPSLPPSLLFPSHPSLPPSLPPSLHHCCRVDAVGGDPEQEEADARGSPLEEGQEQVLISRRREGGREGRRKGYADSIISAFPAFVSTIPPSLPPSPPAPSCPAVADSTPQRRLRLTWRAWGCRRKGSGSEAVRVRRLARRRGAGRRG